MSSASVGTHSGAGPLSLMSCVRESSPPQDYDLDIEKNVTSKRRFWNPKKWFRRKNKVSDDVVVLEVNETNKDSLRSRSTSELSVGEEGRRRSSSSMHPGLSVSHDSVFHSPNSESDMELDAAQSSSSLSICQPFNDSRLQTELVERLRVRRGRGDVSEDDEGFPHSSCNSPTTSDGLLLDKTAIKDLPIKSHSSCSDGSLLSMGSYGLEEDSSDPHSRHSSKLSLHEKNPILDSSSEFELSSQITPLNHSAAHHRVAVKPKRTHGAPRRKRPQAISIALPATPEVNEDSSIRSTSPDNNKRDIITELCSMSTTKTLTEIKCSSLPPGLAAPGSDAAKLNRSKSNAGSNSQDLFNTVHEDLEKEEKVSLFDRLFPRKSGRKKKQKEEKESSTKQDTVTKSEYSESHKELEKVTREQTDSMVTSVKESISESSTFVSTSSTRYESSKPIPAPRSGPASRQRIQPMDIPSTPDEIRRDANIVLPKLSLEKSIAGTSPIQTELENRFKQRQVSLSVSPPSPIVKLPETPPLSPRISKPPQSPILPTVISSKLEYSSHFSQSSSNAIRKTESKIRNDEFKNKMKLPGLSALQQRVLSLNDDDTDNGFKSLIDFPEENMKDSKPLTKSQSFKVAKKSTFDSDKSNNKSVKIPKSDILSTEQNEDKIAFTKASSLDSVKNLDEQKIHFSEMRVELKRSKPDLHKKIITHDQSDDSSKSDQVLDDAKLFTDSSITISGPSHTAIVNVTSNKEDFAKKTHVIESGTVDGSHTVSIKEHQVSITKIQVKQESTQVSQSTIVLPQSVVPEFWNKQLNKVESRPTSNIVFSMKSPKVIEEQNRPKTAFNFENTQDIPKTTPVRKFSKDNLEIIEKKEDKTSSPPPVVSSTTVTIPTPRYKKNENNNRKSSLVSISTDNPLKDKVIKNRSSSLDSLKSDVNDPLDKSSQNSLDKLDNPKDKNNSSDTVVLRKKTITVQKKDEEPELMKVFARRSLKIKDSDADVLHDNLVDNKTRDSDKENQIDSSMDDKKKPFKNEQSVETDVIHRKFTSKEINREEVLEVKPCVKEPLVENKSSDVSKTNTTGGESPITIRRNVNNNLFFGQRAISLNPSKSVATEQVLKKQSSFCERRKVGQWISSISNEETDLKDNVNKDDIIDNLSPKSEFITEPKNFNQRKAEWEKRAQMAQKKNTP